MLCYQIAKMLRITLIVGFFLVLYLYFKRKCTYFTKIGIPHQPGTFPLGSDVIWKMFSGKLSFANLQETIYKEFPGVKVAGYYGIFGSPTFVICDFELIKRVLIKDFDHFVDRRHLKVNPDANKYMAHMLTVQYGDEWRQTR